MKKSLSWKFLVPFGIVWLIIFHNGVLALVGTIALLMGIIDGVRSIVNKNKETKNK